MSYLSHLRVMIVDDMTTSRMLIRGALEELGINQIAMAADGEQALKALMVQPLPLVISDFNMPKLDGLGLLRALRAYQPTSKCGFILMTGKGDQALIDKAKPYGVAGYLAKPFTAPIVKAHIERIFGRM
ncbi:response regulator [Mesorhizobium sp. RP14(2022)]|jgi:two-component system, chemotaxis family, chemotaxis protein CheY|uniref:Response regulator n=1 Tax=Mesorhizobium liriopis TaxID=2953882 RepID=A0ABT1C8B7_9HYPH|nr:response regulator [Mesorhizobium liriopis]MCO6051059.1 response regulator [Mesorhizobium liriopis]